MSYYICDYSLDGPDAVVELNQSQYLSLQEGLKTIEEFANAIDYFSLVDYGVRLFLEKENIIQTKEYGSFIVLNGLFANWLNAYYMWKCYMRHIMNSTFDSIQSRFNKSSIEYRLAGELRNYITHHSFAISAISYDVLHEKPYYFVKAADLLKDEKINSDLKEHLQKEEDCRIDSMQLTKLFYKDFCLIEKEILETLYKRVCEKIKIIDTIRPKTFLNYFNIFLKADGKKDIPFAIIPLGLSKLSDVKKLFVEEQIELRLTD
jgi:hypothetical protein